VKPLLACIIKKKRKEGGEKGGKEGEKEGKRERGE
jgi:hypothetical protein